MVWSIDSINRWTAGALSMGARASALLLSAGIAAGLAGCSDMDSGMPELEDGELAEASLEVVTPLPSESLPPDFMTDVLRVFPNGQPPVANDPDFIDGKNVANPNVHINEDDTEVFVTLVRRDSAFNNGVGFFVYPHGAPPASPPPYTVIWSGTAGLPSGTRVSLGKVNAHYRIGFVLLVNGGATTKYYSIAALNDGNHFIAKYHKAAGRFVIGMEDMPIATGDGDTNDLLLSVSTSPSAPPQSEVCDGKDNDLDQQMDEYACRTAIHRYRRSAPGGGSIHFYPASHAEALPTDTLEVANYFYLVNLSPATTAFYQCSSNGAYLYTTDPACEGWTFDKQIGYIGNPALSQSLLEPGSVPLYRAYSISTRDHFYTISLGEYNTVTQQPYDYVKEGIAGYVWLTP